VHLRAEGVQRGKISFIARDERRLAIFAERRKTLQLRVLRRGSRVTRIRALWRRQKESAEFFRRRIDLPDFLSCV
jgi:hypothetical protein